MRESFMCKAEGDDEYYHQVNNPPYIKENCPPEFIERTANMETYCGKKVESIPHDWCYQSMPGHGNPYETMFTWNKMKPCPECAKLRQEYEDQCWSV